MRTKAEMSPDEIALMEKAIIESPPFDILTDAEWVTLRHMLLKGELWMVPLCDGVDEIRPCMSITFGRKSEFGHLYRKNRGIPGV